MTQRLVALAHLLLGESPDRWRRELEGLPEAVQKALLGAFLEGASAEGAIALLLGDTAPEVRAAGGIVQWVHRARLDRHGPGSYARPVDPVRAPSSG